MPAVCKPASSGFSGFRLNERRNNDQDAGQSFLLNCAKGLLYDTQTGEEMDPLHLGDHIRYTPRDGFQTLTECAIARSDPEPFAHHWSCSCNKGSGNFMLMKIRPGLDIWINQCMFHERVYFTLQDHPSALSFSFCLSGSARSIHGAQKRAMEATGGKQGIYYFPDPNGTDHMEAEAPVGPRGTFPCSGGRGIRR
jgi:hypothetical protein